MTNEIAFIFDMDGTLVDNMSYHERAWQALLEDYGMPLTIGEVRQKAYGKNEESYERFFGRRPETDEMRAFYMKKEDKYRELYTPHLALISGLRSFLETAAAAHIPMAIGTGAMWSNTNFVVDNLNIRHFFKKIITAEEVVNGKPDPETFLRCAAELGIAPENCIVFEDVESGIVAAERAGMRAVALTTTYASDYWQRFPNIVRIMDDYATHAPTDLFFQKA